MDDETQVNGNAAPAQADTAATQPNEADVQVNNEAPEAAAAPKEADVNATDTAEEKLYAGKYKTPEDMEKAYTELQSKATRDSQEKAELTRILNEAFTAPEPQAPADEDTFDEPNPLAETVTKLERQSAVQNFIFAHPDANPASMQEVLSKDPVVNQIQGHDAKLEYAYFKSQSMSSTKAIEEAKKSAASDAQVKVVEKQAAQVESAQSAVKTDETTELYERATGNYNQEDRDSARKALIRKHLINL